MKTFDVKGSLRTDLGKKGSKQIRKEASVPCVIYGGKETVHFTAVATDFRHLVYSPEVFVVMIDINGKKYQTIMKDIQMHPVTEKILHIDFLEVADNKPVVMQIPVKIVGSSIGVKKGGRLNVSKRYLKIKALIKKMPQEVEVDITDVDVTQIVKVGDLKADGVSYLNNSREPVVSVLASRVTAKAEQADAAKDAKK